MKDLISKSPKENKTRLARKLGISRTMLYYRYKQPLIDEGIKAEILKVLDHHPAYGHKRIAMELNLNKKRILRAMKKFGIKPYKRRVKKPRKIEDEKKPSSIFLNQIENICPIRPNIIWVGDFTYIPFRGKFLYLATVMDLFTREIIGFNISTCHNKELVVGAFMDAMKNTKHKPIYFHCDQGSEYDSKEFIELLQLHKVIISMSRKASPWENAFQESFYSQFKMELGYQERFNNEAELIENIYQTIYYYNHDRIHTSLKTSPVKFRLIHDAGAIEYLYNKRGT